MILLLTGYGFLFVCVVKGKAIKLIDMLMSFPIALLMYALTGFFLLSVAIPFNSYTQPLAMVILLLVIWLFSKMLLSNKKNAESEIAASTYTLDKKVLIIWALATAIVVLISTSGIIPVSVTNDSMYYFSEYPRALVNYGNYNMFLDDFLTDASQGVAVIGTIPFLFGFDEIFGLLTFFNIDFIAIFICAVYELATEKLSQRYSIILTLVSTLILITSMPFILMSRWLMANMFFMEYFVMVAFFAYKYSSETVKDTRLLVLSVLISGISVMRMEGGLYAGVIILCIMMLDFDSKEIALYFVAPVLLLHSLYLARIYLFITLRTGVQFMTKGKAAILLGFLLVILLYNLFIRNKRFMRLQKHYSLLLIVGLLFVNAAVLVYDHSDYIVNIKAYIANLTGNSGWGLFTAFVIAVLIIIPKKSINVNYFDFTLVTYILLAVVAGWARGDVLHASFGDSGNRLLIQAVPLMVLVISLKLRDAVYYMLSEGENS